MQLLTNSASIQSAERAIRKVVSAHSEWFLAQDNLPALALQANEFDFAIAHQRLLFSCWTEKGSQSWRIKSWSWFGDKLALQVTRRMGAEEAQLELIPRASAKAITAGIAAASGPEPRTVTRTDAWPITRPATAASSWTLRQRRPRGCLKRARDFGVRKRGDHGHIESRRGSRIDFGWLDNRSDLGGFRFRNLGLPRWIGHLIAAASTAAPWSGRRNEHGVDLLLWIERKDPRLL